MLLGERVEEVEAASCIVVFGKVGRERERGREALGEIR